MKLKPLTFVLIAALFTSLLFPSCDKDDENEQSNPPGVPTVNDPLHVYGDYFYVNWSGVVGATGYYADVATDQNFTNILPGYENMEVEKNGMFIVEDVNPGNSYFVRMRAYNANGTSKSSSYKEFQTRTANVLPNMDMESWLSFPNYESPEPVGVWTSANKVADLNPDLYNAVLFKTDDNGFYARYATDYSQPVDRHF
jgi:hypothetical protein